MILIVQEKWESI